MAAPAGSPRIRSTRLAKKGTAAPASAPRVGWWILEQYPAPDRFPYRLTICREGPEPERLVLRVAERWPKGSQHSFCLRESAPSRFAAALEEVERVPIVALERKGTELTVVLDRARLRRCRFLFLKRAYKDPQPGREEYEQIYWHTQAAQTARRPRVRLAAPLPPGVLHVRIAADEKYPWRFPNANTSRGRLACGDYALLDGEEIRAVLERKTFENLLADFGLMEVLHQRLVELATYDHHALVVEAPYEDFLNPNKTPHWGPTFCARAIADLYARHPRLRIVFVANRKVANAWAEQFFAAVGRLAEPANLPLPLGAEPNRVLGPRRARSARATPTPPCRAADDGEPLFPIE